MATNPHSGRVALVTGASAGIGLAIARALAEAGAAVALIARPAPGPGRLAAAAAALTAAGHRARAFPCDVTDEAAVAALPAAVERDLGPIAILVNNAGAAESRPFVKADRAHFEGMLAVNLLSVFLVTRAVLPGMLARGAGRVISIASTAGKVGYAYVSAYCAAKHGVIGLTQALALEVAEKGITVNAVCPGYVDTPLTDAAVANIVAKTGKTDAEARALLAASNPQKRLIAPEEVAAAVLYLASDGARGVNGQSLNVCGGALPL